MYKLYLEDDIKNDIVDIMEGRIKPEDIQIAMGDKEDPIPKSTPVDKASFEMTKGDEAGVVIEEFMMPIEGEIIPLSEVPDPVFSEGMMGQGFAIKPSVGKVYAPIDGEIITVFPTKHAIVIKSPKGKEVLIHFGLDTINLKGEGFIAHVQEGQKVKAGDILLTVDIEKVEPKVPSIITPIVFPSLEEGEKIVIVKSGKLTVKTDNVVQIKK